MADLLSTGDVAKLTGLTPAKVRRLVEIGRLPAVNLTTGIRPRWAIHRSDLEKFLEPTNVRPEARRTAPARRRRIDADVPKIF